jgi:hypothetical protein
MAGTMRALCVLAGVCRRAVPAASARGEGTLASLQNAGVFFAARPTRPGQRLGAPPHRDQGSAGGGRGHPHSLPHWWACPRRPHFVKTAGPAPSHHIDRSRCALRSWFSTCECALRPSFSCVCLQSEGGGGQARGGSPCCRWWWWCCPWEKKGARGGRGGGECEWRGSERSLARSLARPFSLSPHSRFFSFRPRSPTLHRPPRTPAPAYGRPRLTAQPWSWHRLR